MIVVITFSLLKLLIMLGVLITDRSRYIITLGGAVSSFLSSPDPCSRGKCLLEDEKLLSQLEPSSATKNAARQDNFHLRDLSSPVVSDTKE